MKMTRSVVLAARVCSRIVALSLLGGSMDASAAPGEAVKVSATTGYHAFVTTLSPDGAWLAYARLEGVRPDGTTGALELRVKQLSTGREQLLVTHPYEGGFPTPAWSPNGRYLAFVVNDAGRHRVRVWDRTRNQMIGESNRDVCQLCASVLVGPVWTADGERILFPADIDAQGFESPSAGGPGALMSDPWPELFGLKAAPSGESLWSSPALDSSAAAPKSATIPGYPLTQIVVFDVRTAKTNTLASGARFRRLRLSADGKRALAISVDEPQLGWNNRSNRCAPYFCYSIHLLALDSSLAEGKELPLVTLASGFPMSGYGESVSLSPSGRYAAYLTGGVPDSGDLFIVDIDRGTTVNVSSQHGPCKFKSDWLAPMWSTDEQSVAILQDSVARDGNSRRQTQIWKVARQDGAIERISTSTPFVFDTGDFARCAQTLQPCLVGAHPELIVLGHAPGKSALALARLNPFSGEVRVWRVAGLADLPAAENSALFSPLSVTANDSGNAIALSAESFDRPSEVWVWNATRSSRPRAVGINPAPPSLPRAIALRWTHSGGGNGFAILRLPEGIKPGERLPVLVEVYNGSFAGLLNQYRAGSGWTNRFVTDGRYALLQASTGQSCDQRARDAVEALDEAVRTGYVDGSRAGLVGYSYGGYTVNCIVTRTDRFRAAASGSGEADLVSGYSIAWPPTLAPELTGGTPWDVPEKYRSESPLFHLDKVHTPLFLFYGKKETKTAIDMAEIYGGLVQLGRPVLLAAYDGADHGDMIGTPVFWQRILHWFDGYLKEPGQATRR